MNKNGGLIIEIMILALVIIGLLLALFISSFNKIKNDRKHPDIVTMSGVSFEKINTGSENKVELVKVLENDGIKVYRFQDPQTYRYVYYVDYRGKKGVEIIEKED